MKIFATVLFIIGLVLCASSKETNYTASTPAGIMVREFLGLSLTDSIDFIRWKLSLSEIKYSLECNYGIGKPNTNGFYDGGKKVSFSGIVKKENNVYTLTNGNKSLKFAELNLNLLHLLNNDNTLVVGNGGWSYVLNSLTPTATSKFNMMSKPMILKDSIAFEGRTPCGIPNIIEPGKECYKLKWYLVLYSKKNEPSAYRLLGTPYRREEGGRRGNWKITNGKDGRIVYQLSDEKEKPFIYLLKLDDGVLMFTDAKGNLLVGDHDFSYTLNRRF